MTALSFAAMYALMYAMVDGLSKNIKASQNAEIAQMKAKLARE